MLGILASGSDPTVDVQLLVSVPREHYSLVALLRVLLFEVRR